MTNPRLAERYARSLVTVAQEKGKLEDVHKDMQFLNSVVKSNPDFVALLNSPIIKNDKKNKIIEAITKGRISDVTALFIKLLGAKSRESNLPEIITSYIQQYNSIKEIHKVKLTTASEISEEVRQDFITRIKASGNVKNVELEATVDEKIIGGFVLEMEGRLVDASIYRDLADVKKQFLNNDYIHKLR